MAINHDTFIPADSGAIPIDAGRSNIPSLDGQRRDPNSSRASGGIPAPEGQPSQGDDNNRRVDSGVGEREAPQGSPESHRGLPVSPTARTPRENPFKSSDGILKAISDRFNEARALAAAPAWRQLQSDLMDAAPYLVPVIMPYKDLLDKVWDIEDNLKGTGGSGRGGKTQEEILADFLMARGPSIIPSEVIPLEEVDIDSTMADGEGLATL